MFEVRTLSNSNANFVTSLVNNGAHDHHAANGDDNDYNYY